jgi:hypothetical protein
MAKRCRRIGLRGGSANGARAPSPAVCNSLTVHNPYADIDSPGIRDKLRPRDQMDDRNIRGF